MASDRPIKGSAQSIFVGDTSLPSPFSDLAEQVVSLLPAPTRNIAHQATSFLGELAGLPGPVNTHIFSPEVSGATSLNSEKFSSKQFTDLWIGEKLFMGATVLLGGFLGANHAMMLLNELKASSSNMMSQALDSVTEIVTKTPNPFYIPIQTVKCVVGDQAAKALSVGAVQRNYGEALKIMNRPNAVFKFGKKWPDQRECQAFQKACDSMYDAYVKAPLRYRIAGAFVGAAAVAIGVFVLYQLVSESLPDQNR
jgi:hypothetical protein